MPPFLFKERWLTSMTVHQKTLQEIGQALLSKRLERGFTLQDVASSINVRIFFLECMEEGNFNKLPGGIYTAGLTKLYMEWLGFDDQQCQQWLDQIQYQPLENEKKIPALEKPLSTLSLPVWISVCAIVVLGLLLVLWRGGAKEMIQPMLVGEDASDSIEETPSDKPLTTPSLALYARGTTWIKITDNDNRIVHTQLVKKDTTVDLTPHVGKNLTVGDGRQVVVYHEGAEVGPLAEASADDTPVLVENTPIQVEH